MMTDGFSITFDVCAVLLMVFCFAYTSAKRSYRTKRSNVFMLLLLNGLFSALFGIGGTVLEINAGARSAQSWRLCFLFHWLYFVLHTAIPVIYTLYVMILTGQNVNRTKRQWFLFSAGAIVMEAIALSNPFTNLVFTVDENLVFHRGPLENVLLGISGIYLAAGLYFLIRYRDTLERRALYAMYVFYGITLAGLALQLSFMYFQIELYAEAISMLGLMLTFENEENRVDPVTGLYNRMAFLEENNRLIKADQEYYLINVKLLNLKYFARVYDLASYRKLLTGVTAWMKTLNVAGERFFFDNNFVFTTYGITDEGAMMLANTIRNKLTDIFVVDDLRPKFEALISVAKVPEDVDGVDAALNLVDYERQDTGSRITVLFRKDLACVQREAAVERAIRKAITNNSLQVWYQPIFNCKTFRISCCEALVRLFDDELGMIPPSEFIPVAEKSSLIAEIGFIVFDKVCRFIRDHKPERYGIEYVEVNLSVAQFLYADLVARFSEYTYTYNVKPSRINLEITESMATDSADTFMPTIRQLERMGFTFSMDDYGTGYSNISSILNINFRNIKLDKAFLARGLQDRANKLILFDTTQLIQQLGRNALQEGVESKDEFDFVRAVGCNLIQGYFISKPRPESDFLAFLEDFDQKIRSVDKRNTRTG